MPAAPAQLLGAAVVIVIVGDLNAERLVQAGSFGCETVDVSQGDVGEQVAQILGVPEVDAAVDAVGFEARAHGPGAPEAPATVLNSLMGITRAGGALGIPGLYVTGRPRRGRPGRADRDAEGAARPGVGEEPSLHHRAVPGDAVPPRADDGDPA